MDNYKSSAELKGMAKEQLFGKYSTLICAVLTVSVITLVTSFISDILIDKNNIGGLVISFLVTTIISLFDGIFVSGQAYLYLKLICNQKLSVGDVFYGFKLHPDKALLIQLIMTLITYGCMVPTLIFSFLFGTSGNAVHMLLMSIFFVVGLIILVIVNLIFSQAYYLLQDFPQCSAIELLKMSSRIMKGNKGRLFYIQLSFLPLFLLGILSCFIAFLWIIPYVNATYANFYMDLIKNHRQ